MPRTKAPKVIPPPDIWSVNSPFPWELWTGPRHRTREMGALSENDLPAWMSPAARMEIIQQRGVDQDDGLSWWARLWQENAALENHPEFLLHALGMAATYGWPQVVRELLDKGAPLYLTRPDTGWVFEGEPLVRARGVVLKKNLDVLEMCIGSMKGDTGTSPLHPGRAQSVRLLLAAGADPNALPFRSIKNLFKNQPLSLLLIEHGLRADIVDPSGHEGRVFDMFFTDTFGTSPTPPIQARILQSFIDHGMPRVLNEGQPTLVDKFMCADGLRHFHVLLSHPDHKGVMQEIEQKRDKLEKHLSRLAPKDQGKRELIERELMAITLAANSPLQHDPVSTPSSRPRL